MNKYKIAITTGDKLGIGSEITKKALDFLSLNREDVLIIGEKLDLAFDTIEVDEENNGEFCAKSLKLACNLAKEGKIKSIVTAPVSKLELNKAGYNFSGQTEFIENELKRESQKAEMIFIAGELRVALLTRHCALSDVKITIDDVICQAEILHDFLLKKCKISNPKIGLCAFNPHCGESGILGREEIEVLNPAVEILLKNKINISYPISADALFARVGNEYLKKQKLSYDAIIACYHDQGLCPVKALAFDLAVNTTIGLDVIRTSPSCGTAYDIKGLNIANPNSMIEAIKLALELQ